MRTLSIDIETFSPVNIMTGGGYKYASQAEIILFAYAFDNDPVEVIDLYQGDKLPARVFNYLSDENILKKAFNANFEMNCIANHFGIEADPTQWECTMIRSAMCGLPLSLDGSSTALGLAEKKDKEGKALINYFCVPCKPTKANGMRTRNLPEHAPEKWQAFIEYCRQDVVVEREISKKLSFYPIQEEEKELWDLDQRINSRGVMVDLNFAHRAIAADLAFRDKLTIEATQITGLSNPNSVKQLCDWLSKESDTEITTLRKGDIPDLIKSIDDSTITRVLEIRQQMSKTSVKKYQSMINAAGKDGRVRGLHQHYGANRTGRWAGRIVQTQNLPRPEFDDVETPKKLIYANSIDMIEELYGPIPNVLSNLIRSTFIPAPGNKFWISDFSAIEARVIAWVSNEKWRIDVFNSHGKIYEASASQMFRVPLESIGKDSPLRQKGKISELALGYQGGPNALITMGALKMGVVDLSMLTEEVLREKHMFEIAMTGIISDYEVFKAKVIENEERSQLQGLVDVWRRANPAIVKFWHTVNKAAVECLRTGQKQSIGKGMYFSTSRGWLFMTLPSGRKLSYANAGLEEGKFGQSVYYYGMNQTTKQWKKIPTYGGKFVENMVQAIARDCLAHGMLNVEQHGYKIVLHVHDEVVCEGQQGSIEEVNKLLAAQPEWAKGLPLKAEGCESLFYKK